MIQYTVNHIHFIIFSIFYYSKILIHLGHLGIHLGHLGISLGHLQLV